MIQWRILGLGLNPLFLIRFPMECVDLNSSGDGRGLDLLLLDCEMEIFVGFFFLILKLA